MNTVSDITTARLAELSRASERHLALADALDRQGRTGAAWHERQAGLRAAYKLATIRRKLVELQYVRTRSLAFAA